MPLIYANIGQNSGVLVILAHRVTWNNNVATDMRGRLLGVGPAYHVPCIHSCMCRGDNGAHHASAHTYANKETSAPTTVRGGLTFNPAQLYRMQHVNKSREDNTKYIDEMK